jgi:sulfur-oxidizing protein SoxX
VSEHAAPTGVIGRLLARRGQRGERRLREQVAACCALACALALLPAGVRAQSPAAPTSAYTVVGDAIPAALAAGAGDAQRGRAIVTNRQVGTCLLCHAGPFPEERFQGTLAPSLASAGTRWNEGQLRLRVVDNKRVKPDSVMPSFHRVDGLVRVGADWRDKPILDAEQVEDVVALLRTLREP